LKANMTKEFKVGSLLSVLAGNEGQRESSSSLSDLFTTSKRQKDIEHRPEPSAKPVPKKDEESDEHEYPDASRDASRSTTSHLGSVSYEDGKERLVDEEKDRRTLFIGNLPKDVQKKTLKKLCAAFGKVETIRLRSAARPDAKTTKREAVIKGLIHEGRGNINAYVRFSNTEEAQKACKLNGRRLGERHLRADVACTVVSSSGQSSGQQARNNRLAVFVGNLTFSADEEALRDHFSSCGRILDVRLIRDGQTGVGKGFGYVNFAEEDAVELALRLAGTALDGRPLRVQRCVKRPKKMVSAPASTSRGGGGGGKKTKTMMFKKGKKRDLAPAKQFQGHSSSFPAGSGQRERARPSKAEKRKKVVAKKLLAA